MVPAGGESARQCDLTVPGRYSSLVSLTSTAMVITSVSEISQQLGEPMKIMNIYMLIAHTININIRNRGERIRRDVLPIVRGYDSSF